MAAGNKQKTHKGARKRFRLTKNGKVKRVKAGRGHLLSHKTGKRRRQLRKDALVDGSVAKTYRTLLGG